MLFCVSFAYAQNNEDSKIKNNQWSIEADYGLAIPTAALPVDYKNSNGEVISRALGGGDLISFDHFTVGARYMFNPIIGAKLSFAHEKFSERDHSENNLVYNRVNVEAVTNVMALFFKKRVSSISLLAHGGAGYVFTKPSSIKNTEKVANLMFGLNPIYKLSEKLAISFDVTYNLTLKQHYGANGQLLDNEMVASGYTLDREYKPFTGGFVAVTVGLKYYLGKHAKHTDWL